MTCHKVHRYVYLRDGESVSRAIGCLTAVQGLEIEPKFEWRTSTDRLHAVCSHALSEYDLREVFGRCESENCMLALASAAGYADMSS